MPRSSNSSLVTVENSHHGATYPVGRLPRERGHELDAFVENRHLLLTRHCDRVLVRIAVDADLVPGFRDGFHLGGKCLDRVAGDKPCGLDAEPTEQLQEARTADLPGEQSARNIVGGVLATVRAEPACDRIDIDPEPAQDLLRHRPSLRR